MANHEVARRFKQFDVISRTHTNHHNLISDHYYFSSSTSNPDQTHLSPKTAAQIMKEWNILEKSLPDSIYVRAYEERIDLLRAVIIGSAGTPNHQGLFFFDIIIPSDYPNSAPKISRRHGSGLKFTLNSDWEGCYKLSEAKEFSILATLLALQVNLVSSEPNPTRYVVPNYWGYWQEKEYLTLNHDPFLLNCETMLAVLCKPPKHFEEFVVQHFRTCAESVLSDCQLYVRDGRSKADEHVTNGEHCIDIDHETISTTTATNEELEGYDKNMNIIYVKLVKAFVKIGALNSLEDDYKIGDIIASDIDDDGEEECWLNDKVGAYVTVVLFFVITFGILFLYRKEWGY